MISYIIFKVTNNLNGKIFIGKATYKEKNINIKRLYPRGKNINIDIKKLGWKNFSREILFIFHNKEDMKTKYKELVNKDFLKNTLTYNDNRFGKVVVKTENGNKKIKTNDLNFLNGKYETTSKNKLPVKDDNGNIYYVNKNNKKYISGELKHINYGKVCVKDKNNNYFLVNKDDPRYLKGELMFISSGNKHSKKTIETIRKSQNYRRTKEREIKFTNFPYAIQKHENNYLIKEICEHNIIISDRHFKKLYNLNYKDFRIYCDKCRKKIIDEYIPTEKDINNHRNEFIKLWNKNNSIYSSPEYLEKFYPYIYKSILIFNKHINNIYFIEKIFRFRKNIKYNKCQYSNCDKETKYSVSNKRFNYFCEEHNKITSLYEKEIKNFLDEHKIKYKYNDRIEIKKELDIYIPDKKLAIEFNGL